MISETNGTSIGSTLTEPINSREPAEAAADGEFSLPFDIKTIALALWQRKFWIVGGVVLSLAAGVAASQLLGHRIYRSETLLLYKPSNGPGRDGETPPSLATQVNIVKIRANLEAVRNMMGLQISLENLAEAIQVTVQRDSELMSMAVLWRDPQEAAAIANNMRNVFLNNQAEIRARKELAFVDQLLEQTQSAKTAAEQQSGSVNQMLRQLESSEGRKTNQISAQDVIEANTRSRRLRDAIFEDRNHRANLVDLAEKKLAYERAKELRARELIADVEVRKAESEYEKIKALTVDTGQIDDWKDEIKKLDKVVMPSNSAASTSSRVAQEIMLKGLNIDLEIAALAEKAERLKASRERLKQSLATPSLSRDRVGQDDRTDPSQKQTARGGQSKNSFGSDDNAVSDYVTVSLASPPLAPFESNRMLILIGVSAAGSFATLGLFLGKEFFNGAVRSPSEVASKLGVPALVAVPKNSTNFSSEADCWRMLARTVRGLLPAAGSKIMVAGVSADEDSSSIAAHLAELLGRQDERVLLVKAQAGAAPDPRAESADSSRFETVLLEDQGLTPAVLGSQRMRDFLGRLSSEYSVVVVDAPPLLTCTETAWLGRWCDGTIITVQAESSSVAAAKKAVARLRTANAPVTGVVLTDVAPIFLNAY